MEENKEHTEYIDKLLKKVFADDRNGAVIGQMWSAFRKVASAAMQNGFENGYQIGYDSGFKHGSGSGYVGPYTERERYTPGV